MRPVLIAIHCDINDNISAFRIVEADKPTAEKALMDVPYKNMLAILSSGKAVVEGLKIENGQITYANGSFNRYPKILRGQVRGIAPLTILNELEVIGGQSKETKGYVISDWTGKILNPTESRVIELASRFGISNGKLVTRADGTRFISSLSGSYKTLKIDMKNGSAKESNGTESGKITDKKTEEQFSSFYKKRISGMQVKDTRLKEIDPVSKFTLEEKLLRAKLALRAFKIYYYSVLSSIPMIETEELDTMGVTVDKLYFSSQFVMECTVDELVFVLMHEVCHISMLHSARGKGKEHNLWNIATDLFINKMLCDELKLSGLGGRNTIGVSSNQQIYVAMPKQGLYNPKVDIRVDTPESIYSELLEEKKKQQQQQQQQNNNSKGQSQQGQGQQGNGQGDGDGDGEGAGQDSANKGQGKKQGNGKGSGGEKKVNAQGKGDDQGTNQGSQHRGGNTVPFRGQEIPVQNDQDLIDDQSSASMTKEQMESRGKSIASRAKLVAKELRGYKGAGDSAGELERLVDLILAPKINWKQLLKNELTAASQVYNTFASPDRRFLGRNAVFPGPKKMGNDTLENVKICIDTSGSITNEDLGIALSQIGQLLKLYKAKAELIYWDTMVYGENTFSNVKELVKIRPKGGGGTDANCVFDYFENNRDYKTGRKTKPSIIIMFTDGCFSPVHAKYSSRYGKTIWVISNNGDFKKPFGKKADFVGGNSR